MFDYEVVACCNKILKGLILYYATKTLPSPLSTALQIGLDTGAAHLGPQNIEPSNEKGGLS